MFGLRLLNQQISELQWFRFSIARIDDHIGIPIIVSRTGYTGELGFEIWCHPKDAPKVWDKVWEHGKNFRHNSNGFRRFGYGKN